MNVLIIHQHFRHPDEGGPIRSYYLGQALLKAGHSVKILTRKNYRHIKIEQIDGLEVHYLPVNYFNQMSFTRRIFSFLAFVFKAIGYSYKEDFPKNIDLCYCISTPLTSGIIGQWLLRVKKIPYVFEVGDLWPDAPKAMGALNYPFAMLLAHKLEKIIYSQASSVVGLSPDIANAIKRRTETRVYFVPNFSDIEFFQQENVSPSARPFIISYTGALGRANGLEYLLLAAKEGMKNKLHIDFYIMGRGAVYEKLKSKSLEMGLTNVYFIPFGNKAEVKKVINKSHAVYVSYKKLEILETGSPNKFFDGLAAEKMIILNFQGWLSKLITEYKCGFSYDPEDPAEFIEKLKPYFNQELRLREAQKNALQLARDEFALDYWETRFVEIIEHHKK